MNHEVWITGFGMITSLGETSHETMEALFSGRSGLTRRPPSREIPEHLREYPELEISAPLGEFSFARVMEKYSGRLPEELLQRARRAVNRAPLSVQALAAAGLEAWDMAGLANAPLELENMALCVAGNNLTTGYAYDVSPDFQEHPENLISRYVLRLMDSNHMGSMSEAFSIRGEGFLTGAASASGNAALIQSWRMVRAGFADSCLVAAPLTDLSPLELNGFRLLGTLGGRSFPDAPEQASRPFDAAHEGFIYGQGTGSVILEAAHIARARGAEPLARIAGGAMALDANRMPDPSLEGEKRVMRRALESAGLSLRDVDFVSAHGTSTPLGDKTEAQAIRELFNGESSRGESSHGKSSHGESTPYVNSSKGFLGHCLNAAGLLEAILCTLQMRAGKLHPNANLENLVCDRCRFTGSEPLETEVRTVLNNSFGFGGVNTCLVLTR